MRQELLTGLERVTAVTTLLQRVRRQHPRMGVWEASDPQWWWRRPRVTDEIALPVRFDAANEPVAATMLTAWPSAWSLDVIRVRGLTVPLEEVAGSAWATLE